MPAIVLVAICIVSALLLSAINLVTGPVIKGRQEAAAAEALTEVLPDGANFEKLTVDGTYPAAVTDAYKADGGFVFQMSVTGKASGLVILCGIDSEGKITGTKVISDNETNEYDVKVFPLVEGTEGKYTDMTLDTFEPYLVSKATLTSAAYGEAIKAALQAFAIANGGSVDLRTPEQILQDNCNTALGTSGVKFTKWFATEVISGIDAVYEAEGNLGRVYVIGEELIAVNAAGEIVNTVTVDTSAVVAANTAISGSTLTKLENSGVTNAVITAVYKTATGNYVFDAKASGFSAEYGGDEIVIKVSVSADGKILDCLTVSHSESKGYGDKCATEEYYESWRGVTADEVVISADGITAENTDPGAIAGATYTANGYQRAMKAIFKAFNTLTEGGNEK